MRWILAALVLLPLLTVIGTYAWVHHANNRVARHIEQRLLDLPLPPGAELVDSVWAAQRLAGAGNGMEYYGALLIRSDHSLAGLQVYYSAQPGDQYVSAADDELLHRRTLLFEDEHDLQQPGLFMVIASGEAPNELHRQLDLRGH